MSASITEGSAGAFFIYTIMEKEQQDYVDGTKLWLVAQKNIAAQLDANITYSRKEVEFHQQGIENAAALLKHYVAKIEQTEAALEQYIKENSAQ